MTKKKDTKKDYGTGKTIGHFLVIPQRAVLDKRMRHYKATFMVYCCLGMYTSRQGVCWPNQSTIAKQLGLNQSTVSRHIKKLIEWDYLRYAKKHPGLKGNKYYMVFDDKIDEDTAKATATVEERSFDEKPEIPLGPKGYEKASDAVRKKELKKMKEIFKQPVDNSVDNLGKKEHKENMIFTQTAYSDMHSEYIHNNKDNNDIYTKAKFIIKEFIKYTEQTYGQRKNYTEKHVEHVAEWIRNGVDPEYAVKRIKHCIEWQRNNKPYADAPNTIMFFKDAVMQRDKGKTRMQQLLDQAERNMKMPR
jgi:DNA-binding transcriptional ArsR family regulator